MIMMADWVSVLSSLVNEALVRTPYFIHSVMVTLYIG